MSEDRDDLGRELIPNDFVECLKCGAIFMPRRLELHREWHEKLRKAVDEIGTLG